MQNKNLFLQILSAIIIFSATAAYGGELKTNYAVIKYKDEKQLKEFNQELYIGNLSYYIKDTAQTFQDELKQKIDVIISRLQAVMDMRPANLNFKITLLDTKEEIAGSYKKLYKSDTDFLAFYSVRENNVYVSLEDTSLKVIAHEFAHAVVENYFDVSPPRKIHEVLAQFAEQHILD